jgi:hypothetical protein
LTVATERKTVYIGIANFYPAHFMSEFNYVSDSAQLFYFQAMGGGDVERFSSQMVASLDTIESRTSNFASFALPGSGHCILPHDSFYTLDVDGTRFIDWLSELLSKGTVDSVLAGDVGER